jgi:cobalt-zinc-cadmium efflux system outer membrane protein
VHAPEIVSARLAIEEARARMAGASPRLSQNPEVTAGIGNRAGLERRTTDLELGVSQMFETASRRAARVAGADAAVAMRTADLDEVTRHVLAETAAMFYRAVYETDRARLLTASEQLAASIHQIADRRFRAGDIAILDVNLARGALARVRAQREGAQANYESALGELKALLGIEGPLMLQGTLLTAVQPDLAAVLATAKERPFLKALEAAVREAEAETRLGQSFARPDFGAGLTYKREESANVVFGSVTVSLPIFAKGQEQRASGTARANRLRAELAAGTRTVGIEVAAAYEEYLRRRAAVGVLEADALPGLDENEMLATRSFEAGQLGLPELLLTRREILDTRFDYLEALLEAALARVRLDARAAVLK